jgi:ergothioneine biosynthesis protein EgtB
MTPDPDSLLAHFAAVRATTDRLSAPLEPEDMVVQSMPDASPAKWHLAHTTWFFETFFLRHAEPDAPSHHPAFNYLFNSYYHGIGAQFPRLQRGLVTRPTVREVKAYRSEVEGRVERYLRTCAEPQFARWAPVVELGIHHEQQHQELLLTDIKHALAQNPLRPAYDASLAARESDASGTGMGTSGRAQPHWVPFAGGTYEIGHDGRGFAYDNETPRHVALLRDFELASRPVTCGEWLAFMADAGYERPTLWLSDGWSTVQRESWRAPLYWEADGDGWQAFTLGGMRPVDHAAPVSHISFYEADAYARWAGARLPTEFEWEVAARDVPVAGNLLESGRLEPAPAPGGADLEQVFGDVWEWTASPYIGYPGYVPPEGAIGEYNGKFMSNQYVLRGGSVATATSHIRATYRNFFYPHCRWQFMGLRLARDAV